VTPVATDHLPRTIGELRAAGYTYRTVKQELRENLMARLRSGTPRFPGIVGFDDSVLPEVERAVLAGHDMVLLGERGQGKTRLIRSLVGLLDEWTPVLPGSELNEHPLHPITPTAVADAEQRGDDRAVEWMHRSRRYGEKLATPDTSVGDLVGDVDPIRVAQGRTLGDPETIHNGLVPRTNRGIFAVNELPDLAERIQVSLLNVLEERDIQIRGYQLRLPARPAPGGQREPGGLHQPWSDHHAPEGPARRGDPHPLPGRRGRRAHPARPGGAAGRDRAGAPAGGPRPFRLRRA
jgi:magnesium chelatase subunit I